jgi:hypothetical protein
VSRRRVRWGLVVLFGLSSVLGAGGVAAGDQAVSLAGYTVSSYASGSRMELDSPGLLPVGDAAVGEVFELDVPFSRNTVSSGPVVDALAAQVYPGDTAAHLGSALAEFGAPALPNDPALAEAQYPPSPQNPSSAAFGTPSGGSAAQSVSSAQAGDTSSQAQSRAAAYSLTEGPAALVQVGSSDTLSRSSYTTTVSSSASASVGTVDIGGLVQIQGITATASVTADGASSRPQAGLEIGKVTVAGHAAYIDQSGIHLQDGPAAGPPGPDSVNQLLGSLLAKDGISVTAVAPSTTSKGGSASATSGGVLITLTQQIASLSLPQLQLPGATLPAGTPGLPVKVSIGLGVASVSVDSATAPGAAASGSSLPTVTPPAPAPTVGGGGATSGPLDASAIASVTVGGPGVGGHLLGSAQWGPRRPTAAGIPASLLIQALLAALVLAAPMLGYARWQLLAGRT